MPPQLQQLSLFNRLVQGRRVIARGGSWLKINAEHCRNVTTF